MNGSAGLVKNEVLDTVREHREFVDATGRNFELQDVCGIRGDHKIRRVRVFAVLRPEDVAPAILLAVRHHDRAVTDLEEGSIAGTYDRSQQGAGIVAQRVSGFPCPDFKRVCDKLDPC